MTVTFFYDETQVPAANAIGNTNVVLGFCRFSWSAKFFRQIQ